MKKIMLFASVITATMLFANHNVLTSDKTGKISKEITNAIEKEKGKVSNSNEIIKRSVKRKEVIQAINYIGSALLDLKNKDKVSAEKKLKEAIKVLKSIDQKIVPIQAEVMILEFKGSIKEAKEMLDEVKRMVKYGNYQGASNLLNILKDEMDLLEVDVDVNYLEKKIEEIVKLLDKNKLEEAFRKLALLFKDRRAVVKGVAKYPLGVIKAIYLVERAKVINNSNKDFGYIAKLIEEAKQELKLDYTLGYFYSKPLKMQYMKLLEMLDKIEKNAKEKVSSSYKETQKALENLKENSITKQKNPKYQVISR